MSRPQAVPTVVHSNPELAFAVYLLSTRHQQDMSIWPIDWFLPLIDEMSLNI